MRYSRIIRAVLSEAWGIVPARMADIMDLLAFKAEGGELSPEEILAYIGQHPTGGTRSLEAAPGIQVLSVNGIISHRIEAVEDISGPGGTSTERLAQRFREALADDRVGHIVLRVDSPGGSVSGVPELANEILQSRGTKPVTAIADSLAASAAYWIAVAADEVSVTPSGEVGSIGVFTAHTDISDRLAQEGERIELIHAGRYKVEGNPFGPLGDEARAHIQSRVDAIYEEFLDSVATGRGTAVSRVRHGFGEGRTVAARQALTEGMVDRVETFDALLERIGNSQLSARPRAAPFALVPEAFQFSSLSDYDRAAD